MNYKEVKTPQPRITYPNIDNLGIIGYGENNLYPQLVKEIVSCSESGTCCLERYIQFIEGHGFKNVPFSEVPLNNYGDTADDILEQVSSDLGTWGGFAIHVNYNVLCQITDIKHIPFENCRLGEEDDNGYIGKIGVFPDWSGKKKRNGKLLKPTKENIDFIDVFNPNKDVVLAQIEANGGIESYKGQVLWASRSGKQEYPKAKYDAVVTQLSTEEGLGNIAYRNTRNNFLPSSIIITRKGQDTSNEEEEETRPINYNDESISEAIAKVQGDINTNKILHFETEFEEEEPKILKLQGQNYDKDFTVTTDTACEKIYASFNQEVWHRLRKESIGFSSDLIRDAYDVYSSVTGPERRMIERAFDKIFKHWHEQTPTTDFTIQPLKYISSETSDNN